MARPRAARTGRPGHEDSKPGRARAAGLIDASITAYRHARELYVGPLLAGRDEITSG
jgi:hypothetical protein